MQSVQPVFTVRSVYDSVAWYERVLLFTATYLNEEPGEPGSLNYAVLRNGGAGLHLGLDLDMERVAGQGACNFVVEEFDEFYERAKSAGVTFAIDLSTIPSEAGGDRTFTIQDPDGNRVSFVEAFS
jgi:uncharacterized glyoxalase superfamily protein PhnB